MASIPLIFFLLLTLTTSSSSLPIGDVDLDPIEGDMKAAGYYTFVTLMNMARDWIPVNTTFLMPTDELLSLTFLTQQDILKFLARHSIPSPLCSDVLYALPTRTRLPTNLRGYFVSIINNGIDDFKVNDAQLVSLDVCRPGPIACHGINMVLSRPLKKNMSLSGTTRCFAPPPIAGPPSIASAPSSEGPVAPEGSGGGARVIMRRGWLGALFLCVLVSSLV